MRLRLLDLFCKAGGTSMGYHRAGFEVIGFDKESQPNYPFEFHQADVLDLTPGDLLAFDPTVVAGSPPCQFATAYRRRRGVALDAVNLIPQTRALLRATGLPYVIENVEQAKRHLVDPVMCCGSASYLDVQRHRMFESNVPLVGMPCDHSIWFPKYPPATNRKNLRKTVEIGVYRIPLKTQRWAMGGVDWMTLAELSEAIPPHYTEHLGLQLMAHLAGDVAA